MKFFLTYIRSGNRIKVELPTTDAIEALGIAQGFVEAAARRMKLQGVAFLFVSLTCEQ